MLVLKSSLIDIKWCKRVCLPLLPPMHLKWLFSQSKREMFRWWLLICSLAVPFSKWSTTFFFFFLDFFHFIFFLCYLSVEYPCLTEIWISHHEAIQTATYAPVATAYFICNCLMSFVLKEVSCVTCSHFPLSVTSCRRIKENWMPIWKMK